MVKAAAAALKDVLHEVDHLLRLFSSQSSQKALSLPALWMVECPLKALDPLLLPLDLLFDRTLSSFLERGEPVLLSFRRPSEGLALRPQIVQFFTQLIVSARHVPSV